MIAPGIPAIIAATGEVIFRQLLVILRQCAFIQRLIAVLMLEMLYGTSSPMLVILVQENCRDFGIMDGYVCDRENHREMRFTQFIDVRGEDIFEKSVYI